MTGNAGASERIIGSLRYEDGEGIARMEDRFDTSIDDLWSALTEPRRLARWYGEVAGDLRVGGEFTCAIPAGNAQGGSMFASRRSTCESRCAILMRSPASRSSSSWRSS